MRAGHPLLDRSTFVINQKAKLFELRNQFAVLDEQGQRIGSVEQVSQSPFAVVARVVSNLDVALPMRLEVRDSSGTPALVLLKPWWRMAVTVTRPDGTPVGGIAKRIRMGRARFSLTDPAGGDLGEVRAQNWRARDFRITDLAGREVARVTKPWEGLAKAIFTDADNYVIEVLPGVGDPLRSLSVAAALAIDTVMKQKDSG